MSEPLPEAQQAAEKEGYDQSYNPEGYHGFVTGYDAATAKLREELPDYVQCEHCGKCTKLARQQPSAEQIVDALSGGCATVGRDKAIAIVRACLNQQPSAPTPEVEPWTLRPVMRQDGSRWDGLAYIIDGEDWESGALNELTAKNICKIHNRALAQAREPLVKALKHIENISGSLDDARETAGRVLDKLEWPDTGTGETPS